MDYKIVVALDFGTSRSGYAYAFVPDGDVFYRDLWEGQQVPYAKTLTHLLYTPDLSVAGWGYEAPLRYNALRRSAEAQNHFYFYKFKMQLLEGENRGGIEGPYMTQNGRSFLVVKVIADYLRQLKDLALEEIQSSVAQSLREPEIRWCLTVPAIWNDSQKALMRQAAIQAGLIRPNEAASERLLLALEPEAAALYCQHVEKLSLSPGTCFMIVDCGGGTVDITTHEVLPGLALREVVPGTGGAHGATYVDRVFQQYLAEKLTPAVVEALDQAEPIEFLNFLFQEWERAKCDFDPRSRAERVEIPIRPRLLRILDRQFPDVLERLAQEQEGEDGCLYLSRERMLGLFRGPLDGVVACIEEQLRALNGRTCDYLYLVGGFSTSPALRQRVQETFGQRVRKIVMPPNPGAAIVGGAVRFGMSPEAIRARRARLTYGLSCSQPFVEGVDPLEKRFWAADWGEWKCNNRFSVFVQAGEIIEVDFPVAQLFTPVEKNMRIATFDILATRKTEVRYSDEPGVTKLGSLSLKMPDTAGGLDRRIECQMFFGKTEIRVQAKDLTSGEISTENCRLSFTFSPELTGES